MTNATLKDVGLGRFAKCLHQDNNQNNPDCINCNMAWALKRIGDLEFAQQKKEYDNRNLITKIRDVNPMIIGTFLGKRIADVLREDGYCKPLEVDEFKAPLAAILLKYQRKGFFDNIFDKYNPKLLTEMSQDILKSLEK